MFCGLPTYKSCRLTELMNFYIVEHQVLGFLFSITFNYPHFIVSLIIRPLDEQYLYLWCESYKITPVWLESALKGSKWVIMKLRLASLV